MAECSYRAEQGLTVMFSMLVLILINIVNALDAGLEGEHESLSEATAYKRITLKVMNAAESCMSKYMPM